MLRLKIRNKVIPGYTPEEIDFRVDVVDRGNAHTVNGSKDRASLVVKSNFQTCCDSSKNTCLEIKNCDVTNVLDVLAVV